MRGIGCYSWATFVNPALIKSAILGWVRPVLAQVPLAKRNSGVPGCFEGLRQRDRIQAQTLTHELRFRDAAQKFMATTYEFSEVEAGQLRFSLCRLVAVYCML